MEILMVVVFILGYIMIAFEHKIHIDKAPTALITGMICWALYSFFLADVSASSELAHHTLAHGNSGNAGLYHHMYDIANILLFLLGAMTIVETIDEHHGFKIITDKIKTTNKVKLLWTIAILSFFFSALLDNLTTAIVMISLLRKLVGDKQTRWLFAGVVVIAANAGGAWSVIGDVTTTMLWIGGQLTDPIGIAIPSLIIPSFVALLVPLIILSLTVKGEVSRPEDDSSNGNKFDTTKGEKITLLVVGVLGLLFVPVFKTLTHLPPFTGMMLSLGIVWTLTEIIHRKKESNHKKHLSVISVLRKVDTSSVLFFLGILLAVAALQEIGHLNIMAEWLSDTLQNNYAINMSIGFLSSIVDNVPLVAAAQGMYKPQMIEAAQAIGEASPLIDFLPNGTFWEFLALCAGTGGSCLIIGSAAGVAVMGLEKIDFIWYLKKISLLAIVGYVAGALTYIFIVV
jgi:Na+/H+ antiporter NhaD/arsenite permease-like protein